MNLLRIAAAVQPAAELNRNPLGVDPVDEFRGREGLAVATARRESAGQDKDGQSHDVPDPPSRFHAWEAGILT
jgi:hypothetical protein